MKPIYSSLLALIALPGIAQQTADTEPGNPLMTQMLDHVEKVMVIDSIAIDKDSFLKAYRLRASAGNILSGDEVSRLLGPTKIPAEFVGDPDTGFTNEFRDYMIWSQRDTTGFYRLAESSRLMDGTWSTPQFTPSVLNFGEEPEDEMEPVREDALYPFMLDDGQTLYYASDNPQSLGGLDIFIATKDPSDGQFLIPGNIGLPFNSEYDDYMMAIDPETGVGWWATDRNQLEDLVTIYIYALTDERVNVDPDDELLADYATLVNWSSRLDERALKERDRLKKEIATITKPDNRKADFNLPMPGGKVYRFYSDFKNMKAAAMMQSYLRDEATLNNKKEELKRLRNEYYKSRKNPSLSGRILELENSIRQEETQLRQQRSKIYETESK